MQRRSFAAWVLGATGALLIAAVPAVAGERNSEGDRHRAAVNAPQPAAAGAVMHSRVTGRLRAETAPPLRGRLAVSRDQQAAVSQGCSSARHGHCGGDGVRGWATGLAPAAGVPSEECPDGTMATLARGHDDIIRCMPI